MLKISEKNLAAISDRARCLLSCDQGGARFLVAVWCPVFFCLSLIGDEKGLDTALDCVLYGGVWVHSSSATVKLQRVRVPTVVYTAPWNIAISNIPSRPGDHSPISRRLCMPIELCKLAGRKLHHIGIMVYFDARVLELGLDLHREVAPSCHYDQR